jgi:predicted nucleic acid-binding Zn ribbon protein
MIGIGRAITSVVFCSEECDKVLGWGQKPRRSSVCPQALYREYLLQ